VMESLTPTGQKAPNGGVRTQRLEQLDLSHEGDEHALLLERLGWGARVAGYELEKARGCRNGVDRHTYVVDRSTPTQRRSHGRMLRPAPTSDKECLDGHE